MTTSKKRRRLGIILSTAVQLYSRNYQCPCAHVKDKQGKESEFRLMHCYFVSQTAVNVIKRCCQFKWRNKHYLFFIGANTSSKEPS